VIFEYLDPLWLCTSLDIIPDNIGDCFAKCKEWTEPTSRSGFTMALKLGDLIESDENCWIASILREMLGDDRDVSDGVGSATGSKGLRRKQA